MTLGEHEDRIRRFCQAYPDLVRERGGDPDNPTGMKTLLIIDDAMEYVRTMNEDYAGPESSR